MRFHLWLVMLILVGRVSWGEVPATSQATGEQATGERATFDVLLSPGVAPCVIHVDGLRFRLGTGTPLTARYEWDFGDPAGKYNRLAGFNAAHVYERAGTYAITLRVTDEAGKQTAMTATVTIAADRRRRIYVSPEGDDHHTGLAPEAPWRTLERTFKNLPADSIVLLKAGAVFQTGGSLKIEKQNIRVGRYGDGADPILMHTGSKGGPLLAVQAQCDGVLIEHLTFDTPSAVAPDAAAPKVGVDAIAARGRNLTVRNCTFLNIDTAVNANGEPRGLLVQDCQAPLPTGLRAYLVWGQGRDHVYLGNSAANSTREHIVRMTHIDRVLIARNDFTNMDRRPADKDDYSKGAIEVHNGTNAYIVNNRVAGGNIRVGPLGLHEPPETATECVVIDGNTLEGTRINAVAGSHYIMIRNNIFHVANDQAIMIAGPDDAGRVNRDITIVHNTAINNSTSGAFIKVWGRVEGIALKNNLFVAPNLEPGSNGTSAVNVADDSLRSFTEISNNVWPAPTVFNKGTPDGVCVVGNSKNGGGYINAAAWAEFPQVKGDIFANVTVDDAATPPKEMAGKCPATPGVFFDHEGQPRPDRLETADGVTVGAMEIKPVTPATAPSEPATTLP